MRGDKHVFRINGSRNFNGKGLDWPTRLKRLAKLIFRRSHFVWSGQPIASVEPAAPLEPEQWQNAAGDHSSPGQGIAKAPAQLRHVLEIHAPDADQDGRGNTD